MRSIGNRFHSPFVGDVGSGGRQLTTRQVRESAATPIASFRQLVEAVARLSFHNPDYFLIYRGQRRDHLIESNATSLYPAIYRSEGSLPNAELRSRFQTLDRAAALLHAEFRSHAIEGSAKLGKFPELTWAMLQHYEVCPTPLLDVTQSLRVAASFALERAAGDAFVFVLGFPHVHGSISYSVEEELLNIRLLSICPPDAKRPYFQEGFLVGSFPALREAKHPAQDCAARLLAKFRIAAAGFWDEQFQAIPHDALFPAEDRVRDICARVCAQLHGEKRITEAPGDLF